MSEKNIFDIKMIAKRRAFASLRPAMLGLNWSYGRYYN